MDSATSSQVPTAGDRPSAGEVSDHRAEPAISPSTESSASSPQSDGGNVADDARDRIPDSCSGEDSAESLLPEMSTPASVTSPPYWSRSNSNENSNLHRRSTSNMSTMSTDSFIPAGAITMRDNEASGQDERNKACWAKSVEITDYVVVNGSTAGIGAFIVWNVRVETLQVSFYVGPMAPSGDGRLNGWALRSKG